MNDQFLARDEIVWKQFKGDELRSLRLVGFSSPQENVQVHLQTQEEQKSKLSMARTNSLNNTLKSIYEKVAYITQEMQSLPARENPTKRAGKKDHYQISAKRNKLERPSVKSLELNW